MALTLIYDERTFFWTQRNPDFKSRISSMLDDDSRFFQRFWVWWTNGSHCIDVKVIQSSSQPCVACHPGGSKAKVTMIFDHFPASSRWRRLQIIVGDGVVRQCAIGGWHGGVRAVTAAEKKEWVKFYPKEPVTFWGTARHLWPMAFVERATNSGPSPLETRFILLQECNQ